MVSQRSRPRDEHGSWTRPATLWAVLAYALAAGVQLAVLLTMAPRLFWIEDAMTQYGPAMWWLGQHHDGLLPPLMNPDLGSASNFVADMQYGVLDPFHWLLESWAARFDDIVSFSRAYGSLCVLLIGSAALAQLRLRRVHPALAVAAALGVSTSGFLVFQAASWWPMLWGAGWVLWTWNGLSMRGPLGVLVLGVSWAALLSCGYPYLLPVAALLVLAHLAETAVRAGTVRALWDRERLPQYAALTAGTLVAVPTILSMLQTADVTLRPVPDALVGNSAFGVPNLFDLAVGGPTLLPELVNGLSLMPTASWFVLGLACVPLVDWRRAWRAPGVLTGLVVAAGALAATQLPAVIGPFRHPFLNVVTYQLTAPLVVLTALAAASRFSRARLTVAGALVAVQLLLSASRSPALLGWHAAGALLVALTVVAGVWTLRERRWGRPSAVVLVACAVALPILSLGVATAVSDRRAEQAAAAAGTAVPTHGFSVLQGAGVEAETIEEWRDAALLTDTSVSAYPFGPVDLPTSYRSGVFMGHQMLLADVSPGYGYEQSVVQRQRAAHDCRVAGLVCAPEQLLEAVPGTALRWIDVLSQDDVYISGAAPADVLAYLRQTWAEQPPLDEGAWLHFRRVDDLPGRITSATGVDVDPSAFVGYGRVGQDMERYVVSTGDTGGRLVFWTTYWPGLEVTVDGESVPTSSLDGALLSVDLPAGIDSGELAVRYAPVGATLLWPCLIAAPVLLLLAVAGAALLRRRSGSRAPRDPEVGDAGWPDPEPAGASLTEDAPPTAPLRVPVAVGPRPEDLGSTARRRPGRQDPPA